MTREEKLFAAIGGADEALLERSEGGRRSSWRAWGAALAACLLLAVLLWTMLPKSPAADPPDVPPVQTNPLPPVQADPIPDGWPQGEETVHLLQLRVPAEEPAFRIYINKESYSTYEQDGVYVVRPLQQPEGTPECALAISYLPGTTAEEAAQQVLERLEARYERAEEVPGPPNGWYDVSEEERCLFASDGDAWDDAQREVWIRPDGQGGVFVLEAGYFVEAAEGHGARFVDMMRSFAVESGQGGDAWSEELRREAERLAEAVFADDLSGVEDLLSPEAEIDGYGEDVSAYVSMTCIDCTVSGGEEPLTATASVKHRLGGEDSYTFLTIGLTWREGRWQADWAGLEK